MPPDCVVCETEIKGGLCVVLRVIAYNPIGSCFADELTCG